VAGLLLLAAALLTATASTARPALARPVRLAWAAVLLVAALSSLLAPDPLSALLGDPLRFGGLLGTLALWAGFVLAHRAGPTLLPGLSVALVAGSLPSSVVAVAQGTGLGSAAERATGLAGNAAFLGAHLSLAVPVAAALALDPARSRAVRAVAAAGLLLGAGATLASETRGAWIAVTVGLVIATWRRFPRPALLGVGVAAVIVTLLVPFDSRGDAVDLATGTGRGRIDTWAQTADVVLARPVLGWGPEGFRRGFAAEVDDEWVRTYRLDRLPDRAHNRFLDAAAAGGVPGLAADLALLGAVGLAVLRRTRVSASTGDGPLLLGVAGGLAAWLVQGQVLFDVFDSTLLAWLLAGAALATAAPPAAAGRGAESRAARPAPVLLVVVGLAVVAVAGAGVVADRSVRAASGASGEVALDRLHRATTVRPRSLEPTLMIARAAVAVGDPLLLERAHGWLDDSDDPDVVLRDADVLAALARARRTPAAVDRAVARYRTGLEDWPANGPGWLGLGQALAAAGRVEEARPALERAATLLPHSAAPDLGLAFLAFADGDDVEGCRRFARAAERDDAPPPDELQDALVAATGSASTCDG
jgi:O-antigen ligase